MPDKLSPPGQPAPASRPSLPLYAALAKTLTDHIANGAYPVGELLPTEPQLSERFGVSRQTVREAIRRLAEQGLVTRQPGVGTRVQRAHAESGYIYQMGSLADLDQYAKDIPLTIDHVRQVVARGELAASLNCRPNTRWLHMLGRRQQTGSSSAVALSELYVRDEYPDLQDRIHQLRGPLFLFLQHHYGEYIEEVRQEIFSIAIDEASAGALGVPVGSPAMEVRRRFYAAGERLVISGRVVSAGSRFGYAATFRRDTSA